MELKAGEMVEGNGSDGSVFGEDGFAGRVAAGDDAADVHEGLLGWNGEKGITGLRGINTQTAEAERRGHPESIAESACRTGKIPTRKGGACNTRPPSGRRRAVFSETLAC